MPPTRTRGLLLAPLLLALGACRQGPPDLTPPPAAACADGEHIERSCGTCGTSSSRCEGGAFLEGSCEEPAVCPPVPCMPGDVRRRPCGDCGEQVRSCESGTFGEWSVCSPAACPADAGAADAGPSCGDGDQWVQPCGACGERRRTCVNGAWGPWSACEGCMDTGADGGTPADGGALPSADAGTADAALAPDAACAPGESTSRSCGNVCGVQFALCNGGTFGSFGACVLEGACVPGRVETAPCGKTVGACREGQKTRACTSGCAFGDWSACGGTYVGPAEEICGDGIDNDCDGAVDEGCSCTPVAPGVPVTFKVTGALTRLLADPVRCQVYGLTAGTPAEVVVFDSATRAQVARIALPAAATDLAVDPTGARLVVALSGQKSLALIDAGKRSLTGTTSTANLPWAVRLLDADQVIYDTTDTLELRRLSIPTGTDVKVGVMGPWLDLALSPDGAWVYSTERGPSGFVVRRFDARATTSGTPQSFNGPAPRFTASVSALFASDKLYAFGLQLDFGSSAIVEQSRETIFAGDRAGLFVVGNTRLFDAATMRSLGSFALPADAAVLTAGDRELWTYNAQAGAITCLNVSDLLGPAPSLGQRAQPLPQGWPYAFARLVADPLGRALYGLDPVRGTLVVLSTSTLRPTAEVFVGNYPSGLAVDPGGRYAYVGFRDVPHVGVVELATRSFLGFLRTSEMTTEIAALSGARFVSTPADQWSFLTVGSAVSWSAQTLNTVSPYAPVLTASSDGNVVFAAESGSSGSHAYRFDTRYGLLREVAKTPGYGYPYPKRGALSSGDAQVLFYAGYGVDGVTLATDRYARPTAEVVSASPDGRLVMTGSAVFRASDGVMLGALPRSGGVQAVSPDSRTLYLATPSGIATVDLTAY